MALWSRYTRTGAGLVEADPAETLATLRPVLLDADEQLQVDLAAQEVLDLLARELADALEHRATLADHDALLAGALHHDLGVDLDDGPVAVPLGLIEALDLHERGVRDLLLRVVDDLLADDLGHEEALADLRPHVRGE